MEEKIYLISALVTKTSNDIKVIIKECKVVENKKIYTVYTDSFTKKKLKKEMINEITETITLISLNIISFKVYCFKGDIDNNIIRLKEKIKDTFNELKNDTIKKITSLDEIIENNKHSIIYREFLD